MYFATDLICMNLIIPSVGLLRFEVEKLNFSPEPKSFHSFQQLNAADSIQHLEPHSYCVQPLSLVIIAVFPEKKKKLIKTLGRIT